MKKIALLLMALPLLLQSQKLSEDFKVSTSEPFRVVDAKRKEYISLDNGFTLSVKQDGDLVTIQKFDVSGMKEVKKNEYEDFPKYAKLQEILKLNGRIFYVFEAYNKKQKTFSVYQREIDGENASFKPAVKLFTSSRPVVQKTDVWKMNMTRSGAPMNIFDYQTKFDVIPSFDNSKVLIRYRTKPEIRDDSKNKDLMGFYVFDNQFNQLWGKEVTMPHTEAEMNNLAYSVGSNGTAYMLSRLNSNKSFEIITIKEGELQNHALPIKKGLIFNDFFLRESNDGNVVAAGFYANGQEVKVNWTGSMSISTNINGLYVFEVKDDGTVVWDKDFEFDPEMIKLYMSERQKKKADEREEGGKLGINDLLLRNFEMNDDGSFLVVGEVNYTANEFWGPQMKNVTHFGNIVVMKVGSDGNLSWSTKLPKNQACLSPSGLFDPNWGTMASLGISYMKGEKNHYILFVDNRKNAELPPNKPPAAHKGGFGGYLTAFKLDDATGNVDKHLVLDLTDIGGHKAYQFMPSRIFRAMENTFLLEVYKKGKEDIIVKMELQNNS